MHPEGATYPIRNGATVILAAGASRRLGQPKQLLPIGNTTLLYQSATVAIGLGWSPVLVVVSPEQKLAIANLLHDLPIEIIANTAWREGMAASIREGIRHLQEQYPLCDGALIMVCDQPMLTTSVLDQLRQIQQQADTAAAAAWYRNRAGTPAIFHASWFPKLLKLTGDTGARKLFMDTTEPTAFIDFEAGAIDLDSPEDLETFQQQHPCT